MDEPPSAFFRPVDGLKDATRLAGISMAAPVEGLRPVRAARTSDLMVANVYLEKKINLLKKELNR